jgi:hypothetical protein
MKADTNSGPPARASFVVSLCERFACEAKFMGKLHIEKLKAGSAVHHSDHQKKH